MAINDGDGIWVKTSVLSSEIIPSIYMEGPVTVAVRIPLKSWMFGVYMCLFCVCAVLCLGRGLCDSSKESYRL
jgi:hypothetical protein